VGQDVIAGMREGEDRVVIAAMPLEVTSAASVPSIAARRACSV
jgi:hypothetical protein